MDSAARRRLIVETVTPLFARKGFGGVTTKEIAKAAGVSEALVYRHFPTKAALYEEILHIGCRGDPDLLRLVALPASTATLVLIVNGLVRHLVRGDLGCRQVVVTRLRLVTHSILEDGEYARVHFADVARRILPIFAASLRAAVAAGDLPAHEQTPDNTFWFACHVATHMALGFLSEPGTVPYQGDLDTVITQATRFILRGMGLKSAVVDAPFDPKALEVLSGRCDETE